MTSKLLVILLPFIVFILLSDYTFAGSEKDIIQRVHAPHRNLETTVIDGTGREATLKGFDERVVGKSRVSVYTVTWLTLAMAAATGLGAVPFFFLELEPQWAGVCNGLAAGVMLAASFDLVQEGQSYGGCGNWVVFGIMSGADFIWVCKKFLEQYGEVSMLDIKGAGASKVILVIGIMTLHSFGEGYGVGVSFAGSKGLTQGLLVTLAIAVHNIPEGLAVSMVLASRGVSPRNAMLWSVITSLPQPGYRDFLQSPLQPLMDNLEAQTYETFEKDTVKYSQVTDNYYRPDLTKAALARLSAVNWSLKVAKSGAKKRTRQAIKN